MDIKNYVSMEVTKNNFTFKLMLPVNSNWDDAKDAVYEMFQELIKQAEFAKAQQKQTQPSVEPEVVEKKE